MDPCFHSMKPLRDSKLRQIGPVNIKVENRKIEIKGEIAVLTAQYIEQVKLDHSNPGARSLRHAASAPCYRRDCG